MTAFDQVCGAGSGPATDGGTGVGRDRTDRSSARRRRIGPRNAVLLEQALQAAVELAFHVPLLARPGLEARRG